MDLTREGSQLIDGAAGAIEVLIDRPKIEPQLGVALIAHPHPKFGGTAQHKIPAVVARALAALGWVAVRPNFRGVGRSEGAHDEGRGETEDLELIYHQLQPHAPNQRIALMGFSFGAYVLACLARRLSDAGAPPWRTVLTGMPHGAVAGGRSYDTPAPPPHTLVVHGELDDNVPLQQVLQWARPHAQPVVVVPGVDHFFTGRAHVLRTLVLEHLRV